jgi:hypothetical protein
MLYEKWRTKVYYQVLSKQAGNLEKFWQKEIETQQFVLSLYLFNLTILSKTNRSLPHKS